MLIALVGLDSSGKSTLVQWLGQDLASSGHRIVDCWSRVGYTSGVDSVKRLARTFSAKSRMSAAHVYPARASSFSTSLSRRLWLSLALLDLIRLYAVGCRWWRWRGLTVLCDRYLSDALVDVRLNFPDECVESWWIWRLLTRFAVRPDHTFVMLIPAAVSTERAARRGRDYVEGVETLQRRVHAYRTIAECGGYRVLDGQQPVEVLLRLVQDELNQPVDRSK
jgi:thymidylate kinase